MTTRSLRREFLNLPNAITLTRIALIPVFLWFTYYESRVDSFIACSSFMLRSTDAAPSSGGFSCGGAARCTPSSRH